MLAFNKLHTHKNTNKQIMNLLYGMYGSLSELLKIYLVSLVDCISVLNVISINLLFFLWTCWVPLKSFLIYPHLLWKNRRFPTWNYICKLTEYSVVPETILPPSEGNTNLKRRRGGGGGGPKGDNFRGVVVAFQGLFQGAASKIGEIIKTNTQLPCWATNSYFTVSRCFGCALWTEIFFLGGTLPSWKIIEIPGVGVV